MLFGAALSAPEARSAPEELPLPSPRCGACKPAPSYPKLGPRRFGPVPPLPESDGYSYDPLMAVPGVPGSFDVDVDVVDDVFISPWSGGYTPRFFGPGLGWGNGPLFSPYYPRYSPYSYSWGPSWYYFNRPWFNGGWGWGGFGWGGLWRGPGAWVGPWTWNGPYSYWRGPWWGSRRFY